MRNHILPMNALVVSVVMCFVLLSPTSTKGFKYPKGTLPCKLFNKTSFDCCCRELTAIPFLPFNITSIDLSRNNLANILQTSFWAQDLLLEVDLRYNILSVINGSTFQDLRQLKKMDLSRSYIERLMPTAFVGLLSLEKLLLVRNLLQRLPENIFNDLTNLHTLDLSFNRLKEVPNQALAPLNSLRKLDCFNNFFAKYSFGEEFKNLKRLSYLSVVSSSYPKQRHVHLDNNTFQHLAESQLTELKIFSTYNFSITVEDGLFKPFSNLIRLRTGFQWQDAVPSVQSNLRYCRIFLAPPNMQMISKSFQFMSKFYSSVGHLDVSFSKITGIYDSAFTKFHNLLVLDVSKAYTMQYISDDAFNGLKNLEKLYLSNNQINKLPVEAFKAFQHGKLKLLDLSNNCLAVITGDDAFCPLSSLTHLDLTNNPMRSIDGWIHALTNLKELKVSFMKTPYYVVLYLWTKPLFSLQHLDFSSLDLREVFRHDQTFCVSDVAPNLKRLSFAYSFLYSTSVINDLFLLKHLDVSASFVKVVNFEREWGSNVSLPNLQVLNLRKNKIALLEEMNLDITTPNLTDLDLSDNSIQTFPKPALNLLQTIRYLNLTGNQLFSLNGLLDLPAIQHLDISLNRICELPLTFLDNLSSNLTILDASGNPFSCTCAVEPFQKWFRSNVDVKLVPGSQYECKSPDQLQGESIMEVNLDCKSHAVVYAIIGISCGFLAAIFVVIVVRYRWRIRYRFFLLFTLKRKLQPVQNGEEGVNLNRVRYDAFISYAHENDRDLTWVLNDLRKNIEEGLEPFRLCIGHARDFLPGAPLLETITEAIHNSRKTIIVLSPSYLDSEWCYFETQHAWLRLLNEGKDVIILVLLDPIPDAKMTMWLRQFLCKKGYLRWPPDRADQKLFFRCLRELMKTPTAVNRRYDV